MPDGEDKIKIGVVTVSDRAHSGEYEDKGGPALLSLLNELVATPFTPVTRLVPDIKKEIASVLRVLSDKEGCALIVTTGGTGPALRDLTPDATEEVADKILPGFGERMREVSLKKVPTAILSRQTAVVRGKSLIVNLPGSPKAIGECLMAVMPAIPDCVYLIGAGLLELNPDFIKTYLPHAPHKPHKDGDH